MDKKKELNHAECIERDLSEWRKIFSLSGRAYGWRIDGYKGRQKLVFIPDTISGSTVSFISKFPEDCAIICNKRLWTKFSIKNKLYSAIEYLKHPELFPEDSTVHVRSLIRSKVYGKELINLIIQEDDAERFAAYLDYTGRILSLKETDELLEKSKNAVNVLPFLIDWKQNHYSPKRQNRLQQLQQEREF